MKKRPREADDEMPAEYDFSKMKGGVRGKYAGRMTGVVRTVVLEGDVAEAFPTARDVNDALRSFLRLTRDAVVQATISRGAGSRGAGQHSHAGPSDVTISRGARGVGEGRAGYGKTPAAGKADGGAKKRARAGTR